MSCNEKNGTGKYRVLYNRNLTLPYAFDYKGERIVGLAIWFEISVFDGNKEVFFTWLDVPWLGGENCVDERSPIKFHSNLSDAFNFYVDSTKELGYRLELSDVAKNSKYNFKIKFDKVWKWVGNSWNDPIIITHEEFVDILTNNIEVFDISDNKPAQCCTYSLNEVLQEEEGLYEKRL